MPLSEYEQQQLTQIEANLYREDPAFARSVRGAPPPRRASGILRLSLAGLVVGFLMLFGIVAHLAWGVAGFALMLVCALVGGTTLSRIGGEVDGGLREGLQRYLAARRGEDPDG